MGGSQAQGHHQELPMNEPGRRLLYGLVAQPLERHFPHQQHLKVGGLQHGATLFSSHTLLRRNNAPVLPAQDFCDVTSQLQRFSGGSQV